MDLRRLTWWLAQAGKRADQFLKLSFYIRLASGRVGQLGL